jgi:hypothetical protein
MNRVNVSMCHMCLCMCVSVWLFVFCLKVLNHVQTRPFTWLAVAYLRGGSERFIGHPAVSTPFVREKGRHGHGHVLGCGAGRLFTISRSGGNCLRGTAWRVCAVLGGKGECFSMAFEDCDLFCVHDL